MARWYQYLLVLLLAIWGGEIYAQKSLDEKISALYEKYKEEGEPLASVECDFLQRIAEQDLSGSPDSVVFQYHYLFMGFGVDELDNRVYHIKKALQILDTKQISDPSTDVYYAILSIELASCYASQEEIDKAISQLGRAIVRCETYFGFGAIDPDARYLLSKCLCSLGDLYAMKGYMSVAVSCFEEAFEISKSDYEPGYEMAYFPLQRLCQYYEVIDFKKSIEQRKRLINFFDENQGLYTKECAEEFLSLGRAYDRMYDIDSAVDAYKNAISIYQQIDATMEEMEDCYIKLWYAYAAVGDLKGFDEVKSFFQQYYLLVNKEEEYYRHLWMAMIFLPYEKNELYTEDWMVCQSKLGVERLVQIMRQMANEYYSQGDGWKSLICCSMGIYIIEGSGFKEEAPCEFFYFHAIRSCIHRENSRYEQGIDDALIALSYYDKCEVQASSDKIFLLCNLQQLYIANDDLGKAIELGSSILPLIKSTYGEKSREYIDYAILESSLLINKAEYGNAIIELNGLTEIVKQVEGERSIDYVTVLRYLGAAYMLMGNKKKAAECLMNSKTLQFEITGAVDGATKQYLKELGYE